MLIREQLPVVFDRRQQLQRESLQNWQQSQSGHANFVGRTVSGSERPGPRFALPALCIEKAPGFPDRLRKNGIGRVSPEVRGYTGN
jgi:hypothetical protein